MKSNRNFRHGFVLFAAVALVSAQGLMAQPQGRGGQPDPAPTGPMAPEQFKNIQVLTKVPADQLESTMRYVAAATGFTCVSCHVQETSGEFSYEKDDKRTKQTARNMMKMLLGINASNYGVQVECATCHAGHNRPTGLQMAEMLTPEQVAQMNAPAPAPPAGGGGGGFGGPGGGRGGAQRPAAPAAADVISKYVDAIGGKAAVDKLQSLSLTGTLTNRAGQSMPFTIEEKGNKYRESVEAKPAATVKAFDGTNGWMQSGGSTTALTGYLLDQSLRLSDLGNAAHFGEKYTNLQSSNRSFPINGKDTVSVSGRAGIVMEQYTFDAQSGLLVRKVVSTRTQLGTLREQYDYADYRQAGDVKVPFEIKRTTYDTLDTLKVSDAKANTVSDARFAKP